MRLHTQKLLKHTQKMLPFGFRLFVRVFLGQKWDVIRFSARGEPIGVLLTGEGEGKIEGKRRSGRNATNHLSP